MVHYYGYQGTAVAVVTDALAAPFTMEVAGETYGLSTRAFKGVGSRPVQTVPHPLAGTGRGPGGSEDRSTGTGGCDGSCEG